MSNDPFLASMTFAQGLKRIRCDCDECGINYVPKPISQAVVEHRKRRNLTRTQDRCMIRRDTFTGITVYEYIMPPGAEPLVEFGESHRIVLVRRLHAQGSIQKIGKGIIGSKAEVDMRQNAEWKQGSLYFIPSTGGSAIGWACTDGQVPPKPDIIENTDSKEASHGGPAVIVVIKIPLDALQLPAKGDEEDPEREWARILRRVCQTAIETSNQEHCIEDPGQEITKSITQLLKESK